MVIRRHSIWFAGALVLTLGCSHPPEPQPEPVTAQPTPEAPSESEAKEDRSAEIEARNREILERVARERLALEQQAASATNEEISARPTSEPTPRPSGMEEMRARADELEPRVAAIGRIAARVDENFRRYMDACYEKYTAATASPHAATAYDYYDPYQPIAIDNETTPYCRKLWSDIERDSEAVELAMQAIAEEARRGGVLPGHLRDLAAKYRLDRDGWRP